MILLDDLIDRPPEDAFFAFDAFGTCAGNGIVLTWKTRPPEGRAAALDR